MTTPATATRTLREEHQVILEVLGVLQRLLDAAAATPPGDLDAIEECTVFFRLFADACHHGKEEDLLFPALEARGIPRDGGPIGVMLHEHEQGRALVRELREHLAAARQKVAPGVDGVLRVGRAFVELLRNHIAKEDQVLFMMADRVVDPAACESLCGQYAHVCAGKFDGHSKQQLRDLASDLVRRFGS